MHKTGNAVKFFNLNSNIENKINLTWVGNPVFHVLCKFSELNHEYQKLFYDFDSLRRFYNSQQQFHVDIYKHYENSWAGDKPHEKPDRTIKLTGVHVGDNSGDTVYLYSHDDIAPNSSIPPYTLRINEYQELARYFLSVHSLRNVPFELMVEHYDGKMFLTNFDIFFFDKFINAVFCNWLESTMIYHEIGE